MLFPRGSPSDFRIQPPSPSGDLIRSFLTEPTSWPNDWPIRFRDGSVRPCGLGSMRQERALPVSGLARLEHEADRGDEIQDEGGVREKKSPIFHRPVEESRVLQFLQKTVSEPAADRLPALLVRFQILLEHQGSAAIPGWHLEGFRCLGELGALPDQLDHGATHQIDRGKATEFGQR